jgi:hypothetical protein
VAEEPQLRRSGDGARWEWRRSRSYEGAIPRSDGARLERRRFRRCDYTCTTVRCRTATAWDGCGGEAEAATERRGHEAGCSLAHVASAAGAGSGSDAEAQQHEANELKEAPAALEVGRPEGVSASTRARVNNVSSFRTNVQGVSRYPIPNKS